MDAHFTNALTNALHALFLWVYFVAALRARRRGNARFTQAVVGFFLLTFVLKIMGVYVHSPEAEWVANVWVGIALGMVILSYMILHALGFSATSRLAGLAFAAVCSFLFIYRHDFLFLAAEILVINFAAARFCGGLLRVGFLGVALSTAVWIAARKGTEAFLGGEVPTAWRYDNDLFHLMLIVSTFLIYKGFSRGSGLPEALAGGPARAPAKAVEEG